MKATLDEHPKIKWKALWPDPEGILVAIELRQTGLVSRLHLTLTREHGNEISVMTPQLHDDELTRRFALVLCGQVGNPIKDIGAVEAEL